MSEAGLTEAGRDARRQGVPPFAESLGLLGDLLEWPQKDVDLDTLREMAEFKARYV